MAGALGCVLGFGAGIAGRWWVRARRWGWRGAARPLREGEAAALAGYFSEELLRCVRVAEVERIDLWAPLGRVGERVAGRMGMIGAPAGLTLDDLIVVAAGAGRGAGRAPLLFHEMVHVAQWRALGRGAFLREYVRGWAEAGWDYWGIPLERMAYAMQERFERGERFDAEGEVRSALAGRSAG